MKRKAMRGREAFTTIELLVVISIIAILMALTTAGVMKVKTAAKRAETASESGQLSTAIATFQRDKRVDFIPSTIILRERMDYDLSNPTEVGSLSYLKQVWPQLPAPQSSGVSPFAPGPGGIDWNGDGTITAGAVQLEGDQCVVFFLGGIPGNGGMTGFSSNPRDPANNSNRTSAFNFPAGRLRLRSAAAYNGFQADDPSHGNATNAAGDRGFPSFMDPFGWKPYLYFSCYGRKNNYSTTDCATLTGVSFVPYRDTAASFHQPTGFQIISAGYDKFYGNGGLTGANTSQGTPDGDNITNFSNGQLSGL